MTAASAPFLDASMTGQEEEVGLADDSNPSQSSVEISLELNIRRGECISGMHQRANCLISAYTYMLGVQHQAQPLKLIL